MITGAFPAARWGQQHALVRLRVQSSPRANRGSPEFTFLMGSDDGRFTFDGATGPEHHHHHLHAAQLSAVPLPGVEAAPCPPCQRRSSSTPSGWEERPPHLHRPFYDEVGLNPAANDGASPTRAVRSATCVIQPSRTTSGTGTLGTRPLRNGLHARRQPQPPVQPEQQSTATAATAMPPACCRTAMSENREQAALRVDR